MKTNKNNNLELIDSNSIEEISNSLTEKNNQSKKMDKQTL